MAKMAVSEGADYIYQLNDDTILVSKDWLTTYVKALENSAQPTRASWQDLILERIALRRQRPVPPTQREPLARAPTPPRSASSARAPWCWAAR